MYKPGEKVPRDGRVACVQHPDIQKDVKAGKTFPPCDNWHDPGNPGSTWQYIS